MLTRRQSWRAADTRVRAAVRRGRPWQERGGSCRPRTCPVRAAFEVGPARGRRGEAFRLHVTRARPFSRPAVTRPWPATRPLFPAPPTRRPLRHGRQPVGPARLVVRATAPTASPCAAAPTGPPARRRSSTGSGCAGRSSRSAGQAPHAAEDGIWEAHRRVGARGAGRGPRDGARAGGRRPVRAVGRAADAAGRRAARSRGCRRTGPSSSSATGRCGPGSCANVLRSASGGAHAYVASPRLLAWLRDHPFGTAPFVRLAGPGIDAAYAALPASLRAFPMLATQSGIASDHLADGAKRKLKKPEHWFSRWRHRERLLSWLMRPTSSRSPHSRPCRMPWTASAGRLRARPPRLPVTKDVRLASPRRCRVAEAARAVPSRTAWPYLPVATTVALPPSTSEQKRMAVSSPCSWDNPYTGRAFAALAGRPAASTPACYMHKSSDPMASVRTERIPKPT